MSDKIKDTEKMNENKEITAENLDNVSGGVIEPVKPFHIDKKWFAATAYGFREPESLTFEELEEKIEERKRKKRESAEKMNQVSDLGTDKSSSTR